MIETAQLRKIAALAALEIDEREAEALTAELNHILNLVEKLNSADTEKIAPMAHPLDNPQRLRADEAEDKNHADALRKIAPEFAKGHYLVPDVIE